MTRLIPFVLVVPFCSLMSGGTAFGAERLYPELLKFVQTRETEFDVIPADRKEYLQKLASYIQKRAEAREPIRLTFICTHNSRRSHLAHIWAATAAARYGIEGVETFSGGTEITAFNPRAVAAVQRAGFRVEVAEPGENPRYEVRFGESFEPLTCFSKVYYGSPNPTRDFCAVLTCGHADKSCPTVKGASARIAIPYEDPKQADDTDEETNRYDERTRQIARELLYTFSQVAH